jgi:hypothetical protein
MMDPKQATTKMSGQPLGWLLQKSLGWLRPKLIIQASAPAVKIGKAGAQTSYSLLKVEIERFGALHSPKVKIRSLKRHIRYRLL